MQNSIATPRELALKYTFVSLLGEGANGKTFLATSRLTGDKVAVKALKLSDINDLKSVELFRREAETLKSIQATGVPKFYESIIPENAQETCYIVQEYVKYPSLQKELDNQVSFNEAAVLGIMYQVALILEQLQTYYQPPVIHRDIKPSNILHMTDDNSEIDEKFRHSVWLIDFGAVANPQKKSGGSTVAGTFGYMAPEQMLGECYIQSDFYGLGATALHLLTGVSPYNLDSDVFRIKYKTAIQQYAPSTSQNMISLLERLLAPEIEKRPSSASELCRWIRNVSEQRSPDDNGEVDNGRIKKRPAPISAAILPTTPNAAWLTVPCKIWKQTMMEDTAMFEYTFSVNGKSYVGLWPVAEVRGQLMGILGKQLQFPIDWSARYNPENPFISRLISSDI